MIEISVMQENLILKGTIEYTHTLSLLFREIYFKILSNDSFVDQVMFYSRIFAVLFAVFCKKVSFHKTRDRVFF